MSAAERFEQYRAFNGWVGTPTDTRGSEAIAPG